MTARVFQLFSNLLPARMAQNSLMLRVFVNPAETGDSERTFSRLTLTAPPSEVVMRTPTDASDASCSKERISQLSLQEIEITLLCR